MIFSQWVVAFGIIMKTVGTKQNLLIRHVVGPQLQILSGSYKQHNSKFDYLNFSPPSILLF